MLRCKEIVDLLSSERDTSFLKRAEIRLHLMMCTHCAHYKVQLSVIKERVRELLSKSLKSKSFDVTQIERKALNELNRKYKSGK